MSYINLTNEEDQSNEYFVISLSNDQLTLSPGMDTVVELSFWGFTFNLILNSCDTVIYKKGNPQVLVTDYMGKVVGQGLASSIQGVREDRLEYQKHNPSEEFVVIPNLHYDENSKLERLCFDLYPNDGTMKPGLESRTIAIDRDGNSRTPLVGLLKKAHKEGAKAVWLKPDGVIEFFMSGVGPVVKDKKKKVRKLVEIFQNSLQSSNTNLEELLKNFNVFLY